MADAANAHATYRVSPYLQDVAFEPGEHGVASRSEMLYDHLHRCYTIVSCATYQRLLDARIADRELPIDEVMALGQEGELLVSAHVLLPAEDTFRLHQYDCVEIEINRQCNYRCTFCPVSVAPKPATLMDEATYRRVIDRVVEYGAPSISLNHYSEPTLHPRFVEYCEIAGARGLLIRLNTNASLLDERKIERLRPLNQHMRVSVNIPTADEDAFAQQTGARLFSRVMHNLELLHRHGFKVTLSVNTPHPGADDVLKAINDRLAHMFGQQARNPTNDRAGRLEPSAYVTPVHHTGRLTGCGIALTQINVSYKGDVFLCCQDFNQDYVVGNILDEPLKAIVEADAMIALRRSIFGGDAITDTFICARCSRSGCMSAARRGFTFASRTSPMHVRKGQVIRKAF